MSDLTERLRANYYFNGLNREAADALDTAVARITELEARIDAAKAAMPGTMREATAAKFLTVLSLLSGVTHPEPKPTPEPMTDGAPWRCESGYRSEVEHCEFGKKHTYDPRWLIAAQVEAPHPVVVPEFVDPECPNCSHAQKWHRPGVGCVIEDCPCGLVPTNDLGGPRSAAEYEADHPKGADWTDPYPWFRWVDSEMPDAPLWERYAKESNGTEYKPRPRSVFDAQNGASRG